MTAGLCLCGCGGVTSLAKQSDTKRGYVKGEPYRFVPGHNQRVVIRQRGYRVLHMPDHPKAQNGCVYEHVVIAEQALGRHLPAGAEVHHVDSNSLNNKHGNLVICQDKAFHKLLHVRTNVVRAGGNPDTQRICSTCRQLKLMTDFYRMKSNLNSGLQKRCRECARMHDKGRNRNTKRAA